MSMKGVLSFRILKVLSNCPIFWAHFDTLSLPVCIRRGKKISWLDCGSPGTARKPLAQWLLSLQELCQLLNVMSRSTGNKFGEKISPKPFVSPLVDALLKDLVEIFFQNKRGAAVYLQIYGGVGSNTEIVQCEVYGLYIVLPPEPHSEGTTLRGMCEVSPSTTSSNSRQPSPKTAY
jgi:hypothetical protein